MYATIHTIKPFDANIGGDVNFTWYGNQIFKVRCIIKDNKTGQTIYDKTKDTMQTTYAIEAKSGLKNGVYYVCYVSVFDQKGIESTLQPIGEPFYCFTTPTFRLSIAENDIIKTSSYSVSLVYAQLEKENLNSFSICLYSYQKTVLQASGQLYKTTDLSYLISALENAKQYYVRATGTTVNGISLDTGYILFTVAYTQNNIFSVLELNNKLHIGAIEIRTNIVSLEGISEKSPIYVGKTYINLLDSGVTFDAGYVAIGDFSTMVRIYKPKLNHEILTFCDQNKTMKVSILYREGSFADSKGMQGYFELQATYGYVTYVRFSNYFNIKNNPQIVILCITRIGSCYQLTAVTESLSHAINLK